jgi:hypothetical protein
VAAPPLQQAHPPFNAISFAIEEPEPPPAERVWWRRPKVLGAIALVIVVILNIIFI